MLQYVSGDRATVTDTNQVFFVFDHQGVLGMFPDYEGADQHRLLLASVADIYSEVSAVELTEQEMAMIVSLIDRVPPLSVHPGRKTITITVGEDENEGQGAIDTEPGF